MTILFIFYTYILFSIIMFKVFKFVPRGAKKLLPSKNVHIIEKKKPEDIILSLCYIKIFFHCKQTARPPLLMSINTWEHSLTVNDGGKFETQHVKFKHADLNRFNGLQLKDKEKLSQTWIIWPRRLCPDLIWITLSMSTLLHSWPLCA